MRGHAAQLSQYNQVLASPKSYDTKKELLNHPQRELQDIGVRADSGAEERARIRRDELHAQRAITVHAAINWKKRLPSAKRRWTT
ncbi:hypothetical protein ACLK1T_01775 [Escherichia coli]